ncbi:MAG: hypothetical protein AB4372_08770, partial [Xenococcus sp. (in: cyanobacteria)]
MKKARSSVSYSSLFLYLTSFSFACLSVPEAQAQCPVIYSNKNSSETLAYTVCSSQNFPDKIGNILTASFGLVYIYKDNNPYDVSRVELQAIINCRQNKIDWSSGLR